MVYESKNKARFHIGTLIRTLIRYQVSGRLLENLPNLRIELGIEEIEIWIELTEWMLRQKSLCGRSFRWITVTISVLYPTLSNTHGKKTHMVKQSYMNATASGLIATDTSSGIGGARLRLPSL